MNVGEPLEDEEEDMHTPQKELVSSKKSQSKLVSPGGSMTLPKKENLSGISTQAYFSNQSNRELQHSKEGYQLLNGAFQTSFKENYQSVGGEAMV